MRLSEIHRCCCPVIMGVLLVLPAGMGITASAAQTEAAEDLVRQLGAAAFTEREHAEERLRELGSDALPALRDVADDSDLEVRYRARRLIGQIEEQQRIDVLTSFLTDYDPELAQQISGWSAYAELVGDDAAARKLFVEMYEAEPELMGLADRRTSTLPFALEKRELELSPQAGRRPMSLSVPAPTTAVLLFISLDPAANASPKVQSLINSLVSESSFRRAAAATSDPPIRRVLAAWVARATDVPPSSRMTIGAKFHLRAAVDPALELIRARVHGSQLQYAVFTVARLGSSEHIPVLEELLDNPTILSERQRGKEETYTCQVGDIALAALIHLIGMHPRTFGFDDLRPNSNSLYALNTAGFDSEEARVAARRQWHLWRHVQRRSGLDVDEIAVAGVRL